jgi:choline dehydrogenase-like flavoprotein
MRDIFGIPVLRIHMAHAENEYAMARDMAESAAEMLEAVGAKRIKVRAESPGPGWAIHEVGIARMGDDPKKSVLNQFQQSHDIRNLFVMDGAGFASSACQNPTLTIMALCVRSCDYLLDQMRRGDV